MSQGLLCMPTGKTFFQILYTVTLYSKYDRALTFQNFAQSTFSTSSRSVSRQEFLKSPLYNGLT